MKKQQGMCMQATLIFNSLYSLFWRGRETQQYPVDLFMHRPMTDYCAHISRRSQAHPKHSVLGVLTFLNEKSRPHLMSGSFSRFCGLKRSQYDSCRLGCAHFEDLQDHAEMNKFSSCLPYTHVLNHLIHLAQKSTVSPPANTTIVVSTDKTIFDERQIVSSMMTILVAPIIGTSSGY